MIRIGIIGTGVVAREHATAIAMLGNSARLVAAADIASERLGEFCRGFNVAQSYRDATDLVASADVDLVTVATPPAAHEAVVVAALERGKYVLCEKPLAQTLAGAARIAEAEARVPGRLAVGYQMRYEASRRRLLWLCRNGWIGKLESAVLERQSYIPHSGDRKDGWWGSWTVAGGGVLMTQLIHDLDLLLSVMGRAVAVSAEIDTRHSQIESEDHVAMTVRFDNGSVARCAASVNSGTVGGQFTVCGSAGSITLPSTLVLRAPGPTAAAERAVDEALPETRQRQSIVDRGSRFLARRLGLRERAALTPHAYLYLAIIDSIQRGAPLPVPPSQAMPSLELCMAAYESALRGREISLPLDSTSTVYQGISKVDYDARKSAPNASHLAALPQ